MISREWFPQLSRTGLWFAFSMLGLVLGLSGCTTRQAPGAVGGLIDLRTVDLREGSVKLKGQWRIQPEMLTMEARDSSNALAQLPGRWKSFFPSASREGPKYATFRLTMLVDTHTVKELAFANTEQSSAYVLWVNGEKVLENGRPATTRAQEIEEVRYRQGAVKITSPRVELVLQASTFHMDYGGQIFRFRVAAKDRMDTEYQRGIVPYLFALGILLIFAVQYLAFLAPMTRDGSYFRFGLFCLTWFAFGVLVPCQYTFSSVWFVGVSFRTLMTLTFLAVSISTLLVGLYCQELFPNRLQGLSNRIFAVIIALFAIALPIIPFEWMFQLAGVVIVLGYGEMALLCISLALALRNRIKGARIFAFGFGIFVVAASRDGLILTGLIDASYGMLLGGASLAVAEAFSLSQKFQATHRSNLELLTQVQAKNEELGRLSRIKDDFLANTSHELRTPLHGILGLTQSVLQDTRLQLAGEVRRTLELVSGSATRLTRLVNDILDFSKLRNRDIELRKTSVDLSAMVPVVLAHFGQAVQGKEVTLESDLPSELPLVLADEDRLMQILFNLVGNAVKYTDQGSVCVAARAIGSEIEISVHDSGVGIAPDQQGRIFEPFEQVAGQARGGTGLGLSITSKLLELHGASLQVDSAPNQGTTFRFKLLEAGPRTEVPISQGLAEVDPRRIAPWPSSAGEITPQESPRQVQIGDLRILAIDDEPINLAIVRSFLTARGMHVVTAPDGVQALELIREHRPSVVLLDVMMPFQDGYEVCSRIREKYDSIELPVLFLSARSRMEDVVHGFDVGGNDYVLKPFLGKELVARVEVQARQREAYLALKENRSLKEELAEVMLERSRLEAIRSRLLNLFHGLSEPILVVDRQWEIRFANRAMARLFGLAVEVLLERAVEEILLDPAPLLTTVRADRLQLRIRREDGQDASLDLRISRFDADEESLWALVAEAEGAPELADHSSRQVLQSLEQGDEQLERLRVRMEELSGVMQETVPGLELPRSVLGSGDFEVAKDDERQNLSLACEVMKDAVNLWIEHTGRTKADFAEESGLWKVQLDANGWRRPATLDKYLDPNRIPRLPKWKTIRKSVEFVSLTAVGHPGLPALEAKAQRLFTPASSQAIPAAA
jgi:two-component system, sensor histidine kinase ChiS